MKIENCLVTIFINWKLKTTSLSFQAWSWVFNFLVFNFHFHKNWKPQTKKMKTKSEKVIKLPLRNTLSIGEGTLYFGLFGPSKFQFSVESWNLLKIAQLFKRKKISKNQSLTCECRSRLKKNTLKFLWQLYNIPPNPKF